MIIDEIKFKKMYKYARKVLSEQLFYRNLLEDCYSNKKHYEFIILANDIFEISPVESFVRLYENEIKNKEEGDKIKNEGTRKAIGAFWGYVFREKLNKLPKKSVRVGAFGISKASIFK